LHGAEIQDYCDLCREKGVFYREGQDYQILICERCSLIWTNPLRYNLSGQLKKLSYWGENVYLSNADPLKKRFRRQLELFIKKLIFWS